jgi:ribonucleotide monophosphatase NagD (HAD superfamily)
LEVICSDWNLSNNDIIVVGDSIDSDIEMANRYQCDSLLVGKNGVEITKIIKKVGL